MIPKVVPPLTDLTILVTRPAAQCGSLCAEIVRLGGVAIAFPAIAIEPLAPEVTSLTDHDLVVFISVNAVAYGASLIHKTAGMRIAAIGKATAAALAAAQLPADIVPASGFTSEALLAHPDLGLASGARVLIVRGAGGRELLQETFAASGMLVETLEVYRRTRPAIDERALADLETRWADEGIDVVTVTSVETLENLSSILTERGRELLREAMLLAPSWRIIDHAAAAGLRGGTILARGADDAAMIGALVQWRMRARTS
ncbi:MAG: uroporphyrinogen-III synthase [Steroidobacteraceae bacterium]